MSSKTIIGNLCCVMNGLKIIALFIELTREQLEFQVEIFNRKQSLCLGDFLYQWTLVILGKGWFSHRKYDKWEVAKIGKKGQIAAIFKENKLFDSEYCTNDTVTGEKSCSDRDRLFNNIYTISNVAYSVTAVILGVIMDKFGFFPSRIISGALITAGFTFMIFVENNIHFIWAAWPLMAAGGVSNHIVNAKMALAIPTIKLSILQGTP